MSYLVNLEKFYGPLDLLLYLLEREEIDIYDIPIARITDQYIAYIDAVGYSDLNNIGDFLSMASYLLKLKSRMLLPVYASDDEQLEEEEDPREELVNRILEYKQFKQLGEYLGDRYEDSQRIFFRYGQPEAESLDAEIASSIKALLRAWDGLITRNNTEIEFELPQGEAIAEKMDAILSRLPADGLPILFGDIYGENSFRREALIYFLALLELIRLQKVEALQESHFGSIKLSIRVAIDNVNAG